jgi:hypothetical protein
LVDQIAHRQPTTAHASAKSMETIKSIIAYFANPFGLSLLLIGFAWLATYKQRWQLANRLWAVITLLLTVGGLSAVTYETRRRREYHHEPLRIAADDPLLDSPSTIVVLGAGFNADDYLPANSRVSSAYLVRLIEGVRIHRQLPDSRLVVSVAGKADAEDKRVFLDAMIAILAIQAERQAVVKVDPIARRPGQQRRLYI